MSFPYPLYKRNQEGRRGAPYVGLVRKSGFCRQYRSTAPLHALFRSSLYLLIRKYAMNK